MAPTGPAALQIRTAPSVKVLSLRTRFPSDWSCDRSTGVGIFAPECEAPAQQCAHTRTVEPLEDCCCMSPLWHSRNRRGGGYPAAIRGVPHAATARFVLCWMKLPADL